jgi:hypothetical protein
VIRGIHAVADPRIPHAGCEGKIDRGSDNITRLTAEGEKAATVFLRDRAAAVAASSLAVGATAGQTAS